ncbi:MAG: putative toxin-antitoxin system toxin component, PIN family [Stigonema ocellatum SAG 48.90 = DSM 106950]|nr:putative toxin-antitoxin system toxin component, PIN family [Stigonema ocellatum SAG 48.90 = DSM 106950]
MTEKIKAVIDTSVYIAAFGSRSKTSAPARVINNLREGYFITILSPQIIAELIEVSSRRGILKDEVVNFLKGIKHSLLKIPGDYSTNYLDDIDPKDNILLAAAFEAKADYLITLDKHDLQPLKHYKGTQIVAPDQFLKEIECYNESLKKTIQTMIF